MRRIVEADELEKDVLELLEQAQGLQYPATLTSMHKLTCILRSQGKEKAKGDERASEYEIRNEQLNGTIMHVMSIREGCWVMK
jgi:hypothetical protein